MGHTTHLKHTVDDEFRKRMSDLLRPIAEALLEREIWRTHWSVEVDGCNFKIKVEGYPKYGTPRYLAREAERNELLAEFEATHGTNTKFD